MQIVDCPVCRERVATTVMGRCPSCQHTIVSETNHGMATYKCVGGTNDGSEVEMPSDSRAGATVRLTKSVQNCERGQVTEIYELRSDGNLHFVGYGHSERYPYQHQKRNLLDEELAEIISKLQPIICDLEKHAESGGKLSFYIDHWLISRVDEPGY